MSETIRHRFERVEGDSWRCVWCGLEMHATQKDDVNMIEVGDGPPCTLGVQVNDSMKTEDRLQ